MATATVQLGPEIPAPKPEIESVTLVLSEAEALAVGQFIEGAHGLERLSERRLAIPAVYPVVYALEKALGVRFCGLG